MYISLIPLAALVRRQFASFAMVWTYLLCLFMTGFNCGEAVNFALADWLPFGAAATRRYRLMHQPPVIHYDEVLCQAARKVVARIIRDGLHVYEVSFVRPLDITTLW